MRKAFVFSVFLLASAFNLLGATLAGVTLPDTTTVGSQTLVLNGIGVRTKVVFKVYVAGLYLPAKSGDPNAILAADSPKRIILQLVRSVSKEQMSEAFDESFDANAPEAKKTMKGDVDKILGVFEPLSENDQVVFTYDPAVGTTMSVKGKDKVTIPGHAFSKAMFSIWLGPKPPNADLKTKLLGK